MPEVAPRPRLRAALDALSTEDLSRWLGALDPVAAGRIDARNRRRVIRALEVTLVTGLPISVQQTKSPPPYRILQVGLTLSRALLYQRIDARVERMMVEGLVGETRDLLERYGREVPAMSGLGYAQIAAYLCGETTLEEAVASIKRETRRLVRHQTNWFKPHDPDIIWFEMTEPARAAEAIEQAVRAWLASGR